MNNAPDVAVSSDFCHCGSKRPNVGVGWAESANVVETEARKLSFLRSHLRDGTHTDTVDEGALENLAFLQERYAER